MWLIRNNVPFDLAFQLDDVTRTAFSIVFSQFEGGRFNWERMDFEK